MRRVYIRNECVIERKKLRIKGETKHYLVNVLRLKEGDEIIGFDGSGVEYKLKLVEIGKHEIEALIMEKGKVYSVETPFEVILFQSLPKGKKMDFIVRETTQLGVKKIIPVISKRVVPFLDTEKRKKKIERWRKIAAESSRVSGRSVVPEIGNFTDFSEAVEFKTDYSIIFWEGETKSLKDVLKEISPISPQFSIKVFIGPEGGYGEEEVEMVKKYGGISVSLGKRILKVETASVVSLAILIYELENLL